LYSTSGTVTVTLVVKPWITSTNGAVISNQAFIKSEPIVTSTNVVTHTVVVIGAPVLTITKSTTHAAPLLPGGTITYTIVVSNSGNADATGAVISDTQPANTNFVTNSINLEPSGAGTKGTSLPILAHDLTIAAGQQVTVTFAVAVNTPLADGTVITNTASATCTQVPTPTIGVVTTTIRNPVFTLTKQTELAFGVVGKPFTYTLTITNTGPVTATDVVVTDTLPTGANYISGGTLVAGNTVSWTIPTISATSATQVSFVVSTCQTSLVNASYRVVTSTQGVTSQPGSSLLTLLSPPTLEAQFSYSPPTITVGSPVYFTSTSTTNGGPIVGWGWSFGDSGTGSGSTISHAYTAAGTYTATLTITDTCGFTGTVTNTVVVTTSVPALVLNKWATPAVVKQGYDNYILYSFQITNTGNVLLTDIQVWDDKLGSIPGSVDLLVGGTHTFLRWWSPRSGWYQDVHNVATATARAPGFPGVLSATDDAYVDVVGALSLVLDVSVQPAQTPVSQTVTYTYYLTNSSSDWMEGGTITDTVYGVITSGLSLAPGTSYTRVLTQWVATTTVNMAYARGADRLGKTTTVTDSAQVTVGVRYIYLPVIMKNH
jgi:uncharacterized repeat protein (TIGR01451 family)